jgi:hypothetical protein
MILFFVNPGKSAKALKDVRGGDKTIFISGFELSPHISDTDDKANKIDVDCPCIIIFSLSSDAEIENGCI